MNDLQIINLENTDISSWDLLLLKSELQKSLDNYAGLFYTEETIKDAKNDRATLNKAKKVIEDARKAYRAKCLAPYDAIEPQIKELVDMVEQQRVLIDETVKSFENRQKEEREQEVRKYYDRKSASLGNLADALYPKLLDSKWLNATTSSAKYQEGVQIAINKAADDISAVKAMGSPFTETLLQVYVETLSLDSVTEKNNELTKAASAAGLTTAEEAAACSGNVFTASPASEQIPADTSEGVTIKIYGSRNQLDQITDFMKAIGVRYELL